MTSPPYSIEPELATKVSVSQVSRFYYEEISKRAIIAKSLSEMSCECARHGFATNRAALEWAQSRSRSAMLNACWVFGDVAAGSQSVRREAADSRFEKSLPVVQI